MLEWIRHKIKGDTATGIDILLQPDQGLSISLVTVKKEKGAFLIGLSEKAIRDFEQLSGIISKKLPLAVSISGKGVLSRKISWSENDTLQSLLNKILPNASDKEFHLQFTKVSDTEADVAVIRSETLERILSELKKAGISAITECFLGPLAEGAITAPDPDLQNASNLACSYFKSTAQGITGSASLDELKDTHLQKIRFQLRAAMLLFTAFLLLLVNYLVFDHYWNRNKALAAQLSSHQSLQAEYDHLKQDYDSKKEFLKTNALLESSRTSFYADRLAKSLPASISWKQLQVHPKKKKQVGEETDHLLFDKDVILLSGTCSKSIDLNDWIRQLKTNDWIRNVELLSYKQDNAKEDANFDLQIKIR